MCQSKLRLLGQPLTINQMRNNNYMYIVLNFFVVAIQKKKRPAFSVLKLQKTYWTV